MTPDLEVRKGIRKQTSLKTVPEEQDLELQTGACMPAKLQDNQQRNGEEMDNAEPHEPKYREHGSAEYLTFSFTSHVFAF